MIVIGSYALALNGCLPEWRNGLAKDIDLVCTQDALLSLSEQLERPITVLSPTHAVMHAQRVLDAAIHDEATVSLMQSICGPARRIAIDHAQVEMHIATPEVVWATIYGCAGLKPASTDKNLQDLIELDRIVSLTPAHTEIALTFRNRALQLLKSTIELNR